MPILYIYGPPGSGKTRNAHNLANKFKKTRIIDGWSHYPVKLRDNDLVLGQRLSNAPPHSIRMSIEEALSKL